MFDETNDCSIVGFAAIGICISVIYEFDQTVSIVNETFDALFIQCFARNLTFPEISVVEAVFKFALAST
jgi:hypothetical protein